MRFSSLNVFTKPTFPFKVQRKGYDVCEPVSRSVLVTLPSGTALFSSCSLIVIFSVSPLSSVWISTSWVIPVWLFSSPQLNLSCPPRVPRVPPVLCLNPCPPLQLVACIISSPVRLASSLSPFFSQLSRSSCPLGLSCLLPFPMTSLFYLTPTFSLSPPPPPLNHLSSPRSPVSIPFLSLHLWPSSFLSQPHFCVSAASAILIIHAASNLKL